MGVYIPKENSHQSNSHPGEAPLKIPTQKIPIWNITTHSHLEYSHPWSQICCGVSTKFSSLPAKMIRYSKSLTGQIW